MNDVVGRITLPPTPAVILAHPVHPVSSLFQSNQEKNAVAVWTSSQAFSPPITNATR